MFKPKQSLFLLFLIFNFVSPAIASPEQDLGGSVQASVDGKIIHFPVLKTEVEVNIQGDLADVSVIQTFQNPAQVPLHATYLFPLNKNAAVHALTMEVGEETVFAEIKKIEEAKATFKQAKKKGKSAALLIQHRPNMFTQDIANLMPGLPVKVTISYVQTVPKIDGQYELVVPLIVGPRYQPARSGKAPQIIDEEKSFGVQAKHSDTPFGQWEIEALPKYPKVAGLDIPKTISKERVSINIEIVSGTPVGFVHSETHNLKTLGGLNSKRIQLTDGEVIDNRDFVLRYSLTGQKPQAGFLIHKQAEEGYFSLLIEPPSTPQPQDITPREMVFVLDTSGSMSGLPLDASKTFMRHALKHLRPDDYFRIIRFSNNAREYSKSPLIASAQNIKSGLQYIKLLHANGGTEIPSAIHQAFSANPAPGTLRMVVFLTDGYIGNESEVLRLIADKIGSARTFAFGIGTSINRYLLSEMGRMGHGFTRFIDPTEQPEEAAIQFSNKLESPVLTNISIDWDDLKVSDVTPTVIPDLFAGDSIRIQGKFLGSGNHVLKVNGMVRNRKASLPINIKWPGQDTGKGTTSIPLIWARSQIAEAMRQINTPDRLKTGALRNDDLKAKVVRLGLKHSLTTQWTSFVAVSQQVVNKGLQAAKNSNVPLPMVKGITKNAYPEANSNTVQQFTGSSVPEPTTWAALLLIGLAGFSVFRLRKEA